MAFILGASLAAPQRTHAHAGRASVVRREDDKCVFGEVEFAKSSEQTADARVDFLDVRAIHVARRLLKDLRPRESREVHIGVRHVEEEGLLLARSDELNRLVGDDFAQQRLVGSVTHIGDRIVLTEDGQRSIRPAIGERIAALVARPHVV